MENSRRFKILIADDDNISVILLTNYLKNIEADFIIARDGEEALTLFEQNTDVDLILMDIKMPKLNGLEVTKQIKSKNPHTKIIAETAFAMVDDEKKAIEVGCDAYITKPINGERLVTMVKSMLGV
ncbi:MAG: response regulator [Tenuifilum sp.]|uniref:response regulator n=2 Tax=Tenuifilaceae TaxID=2760872 RepID=UPI002CE10606|nr:response regulator [Tenuifilum sp.]HQG71964.1 response regulator [Tenuifilum sp.]HRR11828.1 response regulator [Tenuifilum sp.]HRU86660.1 response regulator [Tenuifilum sp.]